MRGDMSSAQAQRTFEIAVAHYHRLIPDEDLMARAMSFAIELRHPIMMIASYLALCRARSRDAHHCRSREAAGGCEENEDQG